MPNYKKRIEKWITALENTTLKQTQDDTAVYLYNEANELLYICASGIGYSTLARPRKVVQQDQVDYENGLHTYIEEVLAKYYGVTEDDISKVVALNDEEKKSFKEIAKWIEENLLPKAATR